MDKSKEDALRTAFKTILKRKLGEIKFWDDKEQTINMAVIELLKEVTIRTA